MTALQAPRSTLDAAALSVLVSALAGIAQETGAALIRSAYSSNIKERRDCSAALFDAQGRMIAQAAHIPVHLGAMPAAVDAVRELDPQPDDIFVLNDPFSGGTHLPDITLVSPVFIDGVLLGYAVTRAHHSDVGGMTPGSMPATSRSVYQEGLIIPPVRLVARADLVDDVMRLILANVRTPDIRLGDLRAQIAANQIAGRRLCELAEQRGVDWLVGAFTEVLAYTERRTRGVVRLLPDGTYAATSEIEGDGVVDADIPISVAITIEDDSIAMDFTGTSPQVEGNVNCPLSVTRSACYFALRVLLPADVPTNAGTYEVLHVEAPRGSVVNAEAPAAVVAGNVETSQRIVDTILLALSQAVDLPAQGQGTMNNLIIGGSGWTYYETIGGGQGASERAPGPSGVHVGMSNTLNTPVEALELEYPLRVQAYELAYGTGGPGQHEGGDGIVRTIEVLEPASLSLITDRRRHAPHGVAGGREGTPGANFIDGEAVGGKINVSLRRGQSVTVRTPGGGGWGPPQQ